MHIEKSQPIGFLDVGLAPGIASFRRGGRGLDPMDRFSAAVAIRIFIAVAQRQGMHARWQSPKPVETRSGLRVVTQIWMDLYLLGAKCLFFFFYTIV